MLVKCSRGRCPALFGQALARLRIHNDQRILLGHPSCLAVIVVQDPDLASCILDLGSWIRNHSVTYFCNAHLVHFPLLLKEGVRGWLECCTSAPTLPSPLPSKGRGIKFILNP